MMDATVRVSLFRTASAFGGRAPLNGGSELPPYAPHLIMEAQVN
jgi:hypothetical protein